MPVRSWKTTIEITYFLVGIHNINYYFYWVMEFQKDCTPKVFTSQLAPAKLMLGWLHPIFITIKNAGKGDLQDSRDRKIAAGINSSLLFIIFPNDLIKEKTSKPRSQLASLMTNLISKTWICLRLYFSFCHDKSPSNHHWGELVLEHVPSIWSKSKKRFPIAWIIPGIVSGWQPWS